MDNNEIVAVVGFDSANSSKAVTSCCRKDAQRYAKYYRSIGYHARVMTYDDFVAFVGKYQTFATNINVEDPWRRCVDKDSRLYGINLW